MSQLIPEGFASVALHFTHELDPDDWLVTFGINVAEGGISEPVDTLEACALLWSTWIMPYQDTQVSMRTVSGRFGTGGDPLAVDAVVDYVGQDADDRMPQNCALHVRKVTALGGRKGKGRFFVPGIIAYGAANEVGVILAESRIAYQTAFTGLLNSFENVDGPGPMTLLHNGPLIGGAGGTPPPTRVDALQVDGLMSTQRRRLR